ncbi:MAG TPA: DUF192 domain-containing protein [Vicinamibacterales bacterium]|jgi:hypothetical protein
MLMNARTGEVIATDVELANTRETRRRGLLGRDGLDSSAALILIPCFSVHTAFMRFSIDVVFIDRDGIVLRVARNLEPWRVAAAWGAHAVIEMAGGATREDSICAGDRLYLAAERAPAGAAVSWPIPA